MLSEGRNEWVPGLFLCLNYNWVNCQVGEGNGTPLQYFAWKIPWTEEPGGLQSMGSLRVGHDWATSLSLFTFVHWRRKWQPTPVFLPGESQGRGSLVAAVYGVTQSWTWLKWLSSSSSNCQVICSLWKSPVASIADTLHWHHLAMSSHLLCARDS